MKKIRCHKCSKSINKQLDLITVCFYFRILSYHETCYEEELKKSRFPFTNLIPLNTLFSNICAAFTFIVALIFLITNTGNTKFLGIALLLPACYRLFSYFKFERILHK
jgi:hypothetical protein